MFIYKVVGDKVEIFETVEELTSKYNQIGISNSEHLRSELRGQPKLEGLYGAMYDGEMNGMCVIRYETPKMYDLLSR